MSGNGDTSYRAFEEHKDQQTVDQDKKNNLHGKENDENFKASSNALATAKFAFLHPQRFWRGERPGETNRASSLINNERR